MVLVAGRSVGALLSVHGGVSALLLDHTWAWRTAGWARRA